MRCHNCYQAPLCLRRQMPYRYFVQRRRHFPQYEQ
jgi:hypothetical protein